MGDLHTGPKHPLSGADPESYFDLHMVPSGYQKERATAGTQCSRTRLTLRGWGSLALVNSQPRRGRLQ